MHDLIAVVGTVGIFIATSLSACCRMECFPMSCIENNIIFIKRRKKKRINVFYKQFKISNSIQS